MVGTTEGKRCRSPAWEPTFPLVCILDSGSSPGTGEGKAEIKAFPLSQLKPRHWLTVPISFRGAQNWRVLYGPQCSP